MDSVNERLIQCFQTVFPDTPGEAIPAISVDNTPAWDSVASVMLITVVEEQFHLQMDLEAITDLDCMPKYWRTSSSTATAEPSSRPTCRPPARELPVLLVSALVSSYSGTCFPQ